MPLNSKPPKSSWMSDKKVEQWMKSLEAYAVDACRNEEQKKTSGTIKAFLGEEPLPFSSGELEGMTCLVSMHVKVVRRLHHSSLRYWLLEYLRRQPRGRKFHALILRFIKDRIAALLLVEEFKLLQLSRLEI